MKSIERDVVFPNDLCKEEIRTYFACGEYSSKWGISDFYPEAEEKIAEILEGSDEVCFDVSAKKEIQYATVYRNGDETYVNAWTTIDNDSDIIFDMLEEAYPDMDYEELHPMVEEIMDESTFAGLDFDDWDDSPYFHETAKLTGHVSMDELKAVLNELIEKAEERGHWYYNGLVNMTRDYIDHRNNKGMKPGININCERYPFDKWILNGFKQYETRGKNTLKRFVGQRVFLIKTGRGAPVIFAEATISKVIKCENHRDYMDYAHACMTLGTDYDWKPDTKCKYLYKLTDVVSIADIPVPADAVRHGYVWREIEE